MEALKERENESRWGLGCNAIGGGQKDETCGAIELVRYRVISFCCQRGDEREWSC